MARSTVASLFFLVYNGGCLEYKLQGDREVADTATVVDTSIPHGGRDTAIDTADCASYERSSITLHPSIDTCFVEETSAESFSAANSCSLGVSGSGRTYIGLDFQTSGMSEITIISVALTFYVTSGTCHSTQDNTDCGYDLLFYVHPLTEPLTENATWNSLHSTSYDTSPLAEGTILEQYETSADTATPYTITLPVEALQYAAEHPNLFHGFLLKPTEEGVIIGNDGSFVSVGFDAQVDTNIPLSENVSLSPALLLEYEVCTNTN